MVRNRCQGGEFEGVDLPVAKTVDIDYLLEEVVTLPSLPSTVAHVTQLVNDPDGSLADIGKAISADPALALKSLRLVNSAHYGVREKVTSVDQAVTLLGMKVVKNLVLTAAVFDSLKSGEEMLLRHTVSCAIVMRILVESGAATKVKFKYPEEAFTCGLLHDVGKIIIQEFMPGEYAQVEQACAGGGTTWAKAEQDVIGVDHAEIGAKLAQQWKLTDELTSAIAGHHDLSRCGNQDFRAIAALVAVADYICYASGLPGREGLSAEIQPEVWEATGLTSASVVGVMEKFFESVGDVEELMSLAA